MKFWHVTLSTCYRNGDSLEDGTYQTETPGQALDMAVAELQTDRGGGLIGWHAIRVAEVKSMALKLPDRDGGSR